MHHPDISSIMLIIEDYFILVDDNDSKYQIEPISIGIGNDESMFGVKIKRRLFNGFIHAEINGDGRDNDEISLKYYNDRDLEKPKRCIQIENNNFSQTILRDSIRNILKLDKISTVNHQCDN
jgi:hypothetical protein